MEKKYIYETHLHTTEVSRCGVTHAIDYIPYYIKLGYAGIFVTDHFFNGNCAVDDLLPWEERVDGYCRGYELAKAAGDEQGLSVFFGIEFNFRGDEYLIYGVNKEWLKANPEIMEWDHAELLEEVHKVDGAIVQAHPFRVRDYLRSIYLHPYQVDGVEVYNKGNHVEDDALAFEYAKKYGLPMTSGSDIHKIPADGSLPFGVAFEKRLESGKDYADAIRERRDHDVICHDSDRNKIVEGYTPMLPIYLYDEANNGKRIG